MVLVTKKWVFVTGKRNILLFAKPDKPGFIYTLSKAIASWIIGF
jgi:hypothetical protein